jgi:hypothetical protein
VTARARPSARARRVALAVLAASALCAGVAELSACKDDGTHVYVGRFYLESRGCLGTTSSVDVIEGDLPGDCDPVCLIQHRADSARSVYVATMCPPYPSRVEFDVSGTDPVCVPALAALARNDTCATDGGSAHPLPPPDAAADAHAE